MAKVVTVESSTTISATMTIERDGAVPARPSTFTLAYRAEATETTRAMIYSLKDGLTMDALRVARETIIALLDNRDFLGYQLAHANGSIRDEEMEAIADAYFAAAPSVSELESARTAAFLAGIVPDRFDAEFLSTIFRCDLHQAERAIQAATKNRGNQGRGKVQQSC